MNRYAAVKTVSQVNLVLERPGTDPFRTVQQEILAWISRKAGRPLSVNALEGKSFELNDVGAQRVAATYLENPRYWAARVDDADKEVAQRVWTTEIGLAVRPSGELAFGCRLHVSARGDNPPFQPSIPAFVREVTFGGTAKLDGRVIGKEPWIISSTNDVSQLYRLLCSKERRSDICVFSLAETETNPRTAAASPNFVHGRTLGAAHIAVITGPAAFELTDLLGKDFSVYNRMVRTYRPKFDVDADEPLRHPMTTSARIATWTDNGLQGPEAFEAFVVRQVLYTTAAGPDLEAVLPPFAEVSRAVAQAGLDQARASGASNVDLLKLYEEENAKLLATLDEQKSDHNWLLAEADREREEAQRRAEEAKSEVYRLKQRIRYLDQQSASRQNGSLAAQIPDDLSSLKEWAEAHLSGSVHLHGRALRGAKESDYEEPALVYQALLLLRDHYVPMRRGSSDALSNGYAQAMAALGLDEDRSITGTRLGEQGDEYLVQHNGKKRELDRHFRKGNSREARHCFRLYFFWDDEDEQVVVGWLTSHLDTRQS